MSWKSEGYVKHIVFVDDARTFGGAQIALCNALEVLSRIGWLRLTVVLSVKNDLFLQRIRTIDGITVLECPSAYPANVFLFFLNCWAAKSVLGAREIRNADSWVLNLAGIEFGLAFALLLRAKGKHIYGWLHNTQRLCKLMPGTIRLRWYFNAIRDFLAERVLFGLYDSIFVPSLAARESLLKRSSRLPQIQVLYNVAKRLSIDSPARAIVNSSCTSNNKSLTIVIIGRIEFSTKGQDRAVGVGAVLEARGITPHFLFVGDGPDAKELVLRCGEAGLKDNFEITGWQSDVSKWIKNASVVLIPSRFESLSLVALEAMALKKRIAASPLPCFEEVLPAVCIGRSDTSEALADVISEVLSLDEVELEDMYSPYLKKFSRDAFMKSFCACLGMSDAYQDLQPLQHA